MKAVTLLLRGWQGGEQRAFDRLMKLADDELRRLAASCVRAEGPGGVPWLTELASGGRPSGWPRASDSGRANACARGASWRACCAGSGPTRRAGGERPRAY